MKEFKNLFRAIRISIFVLHTLWVIKSVVEIFKAEVFKGRDIVPYFFILAFFMASYLLFSILYEKAVPTKKRSDKLLARFVYMFETMLVTSGILILSIIVKRVFLG